MKVRYVGPHDAVEVGGVVVRRGDVADLPKEVLDQPDNWQPAVTKKES